MAAAKVRLSTWFSKFTKFLSHPTVHWSDLDDLGVSTEGGYDKQAIKQMIERKRKNDLIRRREFEKLRSREGRRVVAMSRVSGAQSSLTTDQGGREVTLKKIDEIEAQMSQQWWKGRHLSASEPRQADVQSQLRDADSTRSAESAISPESTRMRHLVHTKPAPLGVPTLGHVDTKAGSGGSSSEMLRPMSVGHATTGAHKPSAARDVAVASHGATSLVVHYPLTETDPELEEAAIRFANGDDTGAERGLLQALREAPIASATTVSWVNALLDLYRVTNNRPSFDRALVGFAVHLGQSVPLWTRHAADVASAPRETAQAASLRPQDRESQTLSVEIRSSPIWICPEQLTVDAMRQLLTVVAAHTMPWHLDWSQLKHISPDAMSMLGEFFGGLCDESVDLHLSGATALARTLQAMMPAGQRDVSAAWWGVRLNVLRAMQRREEFKLAAQDCAATYGVPAPAWTPSACQCVHVGLATSSHSDATASLSAAPAVATRMGLAGLGDPSLQVITLRGELLGATHALTEASIASQPDSGLRIVVQCAQLTRVDFSAAGSLLSWAAAQQARGCYVEFRSVHRLIAAFFHVVGISAHALVAPKTA